MEGTKEAELVTAVLMYAMRCLITLGQTAHGIHQDCRNQVCFLGPLHRTQSQIIVPVSAAR